MPTYLISSHGDPKWDKETTVPANLSVRFYQSFGKPMPNSTGLLLQSALTNPGHPGASGVFATYPQVALWNEGNRKPEINLTGDNHAFYSGIFCATSGQVVQAIGTNQLVTLSWALSQIATHAAANYPNDKSTVVVHCLFCL
jgi:hypothetical protein